MYWLLWKGWRWYEALSYVRFSGVGSLLLYASMPIMMYPVIALATQGMKKCSADTNTRANRLSDEIYSVRSVEVRSGKCDIFIAKISKRVFKHVKNRHDFNRVKKQIDYQINKGMTPEEAFAFVNANDGRNYFNKSWSEATIEDAMQYDPCCQSRTPKQGRFY